MPHNKIPVLDLAPEINMLWDELNAAFQTVLRSGHFIMGEQVATFEKQFADYLGVKHVISMNSGTDALVIGLRALGVGQGDEVITTPFSFFATAEAPSGIGAIPVFVDIDPATFNLDVTQVEKAITPRTRAIIPVHLFGGAADLDPLLALAQKYNLKILEDVAQAFSGSYKGRKLGTLGHASAFSFFPSKNLGAYGDAGLLTTDDDDVAQVAKMLRVHGSLKKYHNEIVGYNSRMDTLQAAILSVKLPHVDSFSAGRRKAAQIYTELLQDIPGVIPPCEAPYARHVYHQYTLRILDGKRDAVQKKLEAAGIATMVYYPVPIHKLPIYANRNLHLPEAEKAASEVLSLPIWPQITRDVQERVIAALRDALA
ncbi:MAG: DegT/DnrJ/EryC1/StrS family aminotransferase [Anaerolineae bacterium]|nr:DegT/DnrJ/EryC1/StrS family aminotransferase [Anaerolineae bacterium]